jgi:hypothetical protein
VLLASSFTGDPLGNYAIEQCVLTKGVGMKKPVRRRSKPWNGAVADRLARLWQGIDWARLRAAANQVLDILSKLAAPAAVVVAALVAQNFQSSMTVSQMLSQREQSDTQIRAEMFKAITAKLLRNDDPVEPERRAVFSELLALNFHEHIELKPLLQEVDDALLDKTRSGITAAYAKRVALRREELRSVARRVRERQVAMLVRDESGHRPKPALASWAAWSVWTPPSTLLEQASEEGKIRYIGVRFSGPRVSAAVRSRRPCDVAPEEGQNVCVAEPAIENAPDGKSAISIVVNAKPDWQREAFTVQIKRLPRLELSPEEQADLKRQESGGAERCGVTMLDAASDASAATYGPAVIEFQTTWFDFPLTDNTLLATGSRYSVFVDQVCRDTVKGGAMVKLGLLWFPKDYFPARERPTNYRQLRDKLQLPSGGT